MHKEYLMLPGPTMVPPTVLQATARQMISHRGEAYRALFDRVERGLKKVFGTSGDVFVIPGAGTGAMEAAVVNLLSPGDKVLSVVNGVFGERFSEVLVAFGADVKVLKAPYGEAVPPEAVAETLYADAGIKAVFLTHNETSTGAVMDIKRTAELCRGHEALIVVDAVSSLAALELRMDDWGLDVVITASQKALMVPPGLAIIAVSRRAWPAVEAARLPRYYWDLRAHKKSALKKENPFTPAVSLLAGLDEALSLIEEEGLEAIYRRHRLMGRMVREGVKAMGLEVLADDDVASDCITAVILPEGIDPKAVRKAMAGRGVVVAGGQKELSGRIVRLAHLGYVDTNDVLVMLNALEGALADLGYDLPPGIGVEKALDVLSKETAA